MSEGLYSQAKRMAAEEWDIDLPYGITWASIDDVMRLRNEYIDRALGELRGE